MRTIVWSVPAGQDLGRLSADVAERVTGAVERYAVVGLGDIRHLTGLPGNYRLRVGDWRVIFTLGVGTVTIERILPRGRAYRD